MSIERHNASRPAMTFGARVAQSRKEHGLTQEELAEQVGCDRSNISRIERDRVRPSVKLARQLARQLAAPNQVKAFMRAALHVSAPQLVSFSPLDVATPNTNNPGENFHNSPPSKAVAQAVIICVPFSPVTDSTTIFTNLITAFRHMYESGEDFFVHEI